MSSKNPRQKPTKMMPRPQIDKHLEVRVGVAGNSDKEKLAILISPSKQGKHIFGFLTVGRTLLSPRFR
jgi:hypothetical protein